MDENQQQAVEPPMTPPIDLEALIALVEARIVENLAQMIERLAGAKGS